AKVNKLSKAAPIRRNGIAPDHVCDKACIVGSVVEATGKGTNIKRPRVRPANLVGSGANAATRRVWSLAAQRATVSCATRCLAFCCLAVLGRSQRGAVARDTE